MKTSIHESIMDVMKERVVLFYPERQMLVYCHEHHLKVRGEQYSEEIDLGVCTYMRVMKFCTLFGIDPKAFVFEVREVSHEPKVD